jgi:ketosteroid isomerase-like protein
MPRSIKIEEHSTMVLSDRAVLFAGFDTFSQTREGKAADTPARFTLLITKGDQGWQISHFHSSVRPKPQ